jgi:hypothetical protein
MVTYWDAAPVDEAAIMTSWSAGLIGASALCAAARPFALRRAASAAGKS